METLRGKRKLRTCARAVCDNNAGGGHTIAGLATAVILGT